MIRQRYDPAWIDKVRDRIRKSDEDPSATDASRKFNRLYLEYQEKNAEEYERLTPYERFVRSINFRVLGILTFILGLLAWPAFLLSSILITLRYFRLNAKMAREAEVPFWTTMRHIHLPVLLNSYPLRFVLWSAIVAIACWCYLLLNAGLR